MLPSIFGENLFDEFFDDAFGVIPVSKAHSMLYGKHGKNLLKTDIRELEHGYEIDMDLPGFKKDEVKVDVENGYLLVSAAKGLDKEEEKDGKYIRKERYAGQCCRSFYIGEGVEPKNVTAKFEDGILRLSVPKAELKKPSGGSSVVIQ